MKLANLFVRSKEKIFFIAGPCVLESLDLALKVGEKLAQIADKLKVLLIFKSSFDKANRSSLASFRGPGLEQGLRWLEQVKARTGLPVLTDYHLPEQAKMVAEVVDVLQVPAFLSRQTDLLLAGAKTGKIINVKKAQFMAPWDMQNVVEKITQCGNNQIWLTERGTCFGYNNLVVDMRSLAIMSKLGFPVIFDATHSVQLPGGKGSCSGGQPEFVPVLSQAAAGAGVDGVFLEVHPDPKQALCDGPNSWPLDKVFPLMKKLIKIWQVARFD